MKGTRARTLSARGGYHGVVDEYLTEQRNEEKLEPVRVLKVVARVSRFSRSVWDDLLSPGGVYTSSSRVRSAFYYSVSQGGKAGKR